MLSKKDIKFNGKAAETEIIMKLKSTHFDIKTCLSSLNRWRHLARLNVYFSQAKPGMKV